MYYKVNNIIPDVMKPNLPNLNYVLHGTFVCLNAAYVNTVVDNVAAVVTIVPTIIYIIYCLFVETILGVDQTINQTIDNVALVLNKVKPVENINHENSRVIQ